MLIKLSKFMMYLRAKSFGQAFDVDNFEGIFIEVHLLVAVVAFGRLDVVAELVGRKTRSAAKFPGLFFARQKSHLKRQK
jgi:hypothetical protein